MRDENSHASHAEACLAAITASSYDAIVSRAADGTILAWNPAAERLFGYAADEVTGRNIALLAFPSADSPALSRALLSGTSPVLDQQCVLLAKDASPVHVRARQVAVRDGNGEIVAMSLVMRAESHDAEQELKRKADITRLMEAMARAVNEASTPETALRACLEHILVHGGWTIGRIVAFRGGGAPLVAETLLWHGEDDPLLRVFRNASEGFDYSGLTGQFVSRVLREKRPVWIDDLQQAEGRGRLIDAMAAGLRSAFAFPVIVRGSVGALLEFFAREARPADALLIENIEAIASQLARVVERGESEAALARLAAIVEDSHVAIISRSLEGRIVSWNRAAERMLGYTAEEAIGREAGFIVSRSRQHRIDANTERLLRGEIVEPYESERVAKDGTIVSVLVTISPLKDAAGKTVGASFILHDISALKRAEAALRQSERQFRQLATNIPEVFWIMDVATQAITFVSPAYQRVWGRAWKGEPIRLDAWMEVLHPDDRRRVRKAMKDLVEGGYSQEYRVMRPDGSFRWIHDRAFPVREDLNRVTRITGIAEDITERKEIEEQLRYLAHFDQLTGLPNRVLFKDRLEQALAQAARTRRHVAVLFVDLDGFKIVNDTYGHAAADDLLADVARRLKSCTRASDTVARLGGDEFGIVVTNLDHEKSGYRVAQKIIEALARPFYSPGKEAFVSASIGLAVYPWDGMDAERLTRNADTAMYKAKQLGRNNCQRYTAEMDASVQQRLALEKYLRRAVEDNAFRLHYQPAVSLRTGMVTQMEALLRWNHPERGEVSPSDFVPLLEDLGLIARVSDWVLRNACEQANVWRGAGHGAVKVAVNVSARQLLNQDLSKHVLSVVRETACDPQQIELEITESFLMLNIDAAAQTLSELRDAGINLTLDDFGTGYSSLSHLSRFPIDAVKIDRTFVVDLPGNRHHAAIARSVINLAHNLDMRVIAEGVESAPQLDFLCGHQCDEVQGYYFARAVPAHECLPLLGRSWPVGAVAADTR
ncbi:MAG: EAL domain-containing protein [Methanocella sp.]